MKIFTYKIFATLAALFLATSQTLPHVLHWSDASEIPREHAGYEWVCTDGNGRPLATFTYDPAGNLLTANNSAANITFTYDAMNRVATAANHHTYGNPPFTAITSWKRDLGGLVTNLTHAAGKSVTQTYDPDGRLSSVTDWLGNTWTFTRDAEGKPTSLASPDGITTAYTYDPAGRLTARSSSLSARTISYDAANRRIRDDITAGPLPQPQLCRTAQNTFDAADKLVSAYVRYGATNIVTETFSYDNNGSLTNWLSGANSLNLSYNSLGQVSTIKGAQTFLSVCEYDVLGNRLTLLRLFHCMVYKTC